MGGALNDSAPVAFAEVDGTTRACSPRETIERVMPLLPVFGITRIANVTGLDTIGIPVVMVTRPNARSVSVSQGKGATLDAAKASGLMEAIEIHHAEHILAPLLLGSFNELRFRETVADVASMALSTHRNLTATARFLWIQGHDLASGAPVWLPYEAVHTDYRKPFPEGSGYFLCTSNGLASGNTLDEADLPWSLRGDREGQRCALAIEVEGGARPPGGGSVDGDRSPLPRIARPLRNGQRSGAGLGSDIRHRRARLLRVDTHGPRRGALLGERVSWARMPSVRLHRLVARLDGSGPGASHHDRRRPR